MIHRITALLTLLIALALLVGCAWRQTDRRWVSDRRFNQVWEHYQTTDSVAETEEVLRDQQWRPGEINECLYRIRQLERAQELYGEVRFPPRAEPRALTGATFRLQ
jgi:hypothetical protein